MKPNTVVGEIEYRLKIVDKKNIYRCWQNSIQAEKILGYLKSVTGKMEAGRGITMYLKSLKFATNSVYASPIN
jgi:translation elongation factor EF-1alpha